MTGIIGIDGTRITRDGQPFRFTGLSFFNALYNPRFNQSPEERLRWLNLFRDTGVNGLRVWCQWDFTPPRNFIDTSPTNSMYTDSGEIREEHLSTLIALIEATNSLGMLLEVTLFSHEKRPNLPGDVLVQGAGALAARLVPYKNLIIQLWNEDSTEWHRIFRAVKDADPSRLVTSSPGVSNVLGDDEQNQAYDLLSPHTIRQSPNVPFWEIAPGQIADLIARFGKPVIDDEPARSGPTQFGGIEGGTKAEWHIAHIKRVREVGGYPIYHHDMFQYGYDSPLTPPSGIPEPDFRPLHREVFAYLRQTKE